MHIDKELVAASATPLVLGILAMQGATTRSNQDAYESGEAKVINAAAGAMIEAHPDRFVAGIATVDPNDPNAGAVV